MKKKIDYKIILIIVLLIIFIILAGLYFNPNMFSNLFNSSNSDDNTTSTTTTEAEVEKKTILNTISSTGEIMSSIEEKLELHATYYFSEIYFEEGDLVAQGEKILKYTNGTYLTAPYNLAITKLNIPGEGEKCTNSHYITVKGTDTLTMSLSVAEDELDTVYVGQEARIEVSVLEDANYTGYVTNISNVATYSGSSSKFAVTVEFQNDGQILLGMSGNCQVVLEKAEDVVAVPKEAVTTTNGVSYVTVINSDNSTSTVQIETGISNDAYTEVKSGLDVGQKVQIIEQTSSSTTNNYNSGSNMKMQMMQDSGTFAMPSGTMSGEKPSRQN